MKGASAEVTEPVTVAVPGEDGLSVAVAPARTLDCWETRGSAFRTELKVVPARATATCADSVSRIRLTVAELLVPEAVPDAVPVAETTTELSVPSAGLNCATDIVVGPQLVFCNETAAEPGERELLPTGQDWPQANGTMTIAAKQTCETDRSFRARSKPVVRGDLDFSRIVDYLVGNYFNKKGPPGSVWRNSGEPENYCCFAPWGSFAGKRHQTAPAPQASGQLHGNGSGPDSRQAHGRCLGRAKPPN